MALESVDVVVPLLPDLFRDELGWELLRFEDLLVNADDEDLFVERACPPPSPRA
jgi:hypothetical protein